MASRVDAQFSSEGARVRRPAVTRALAGWAAAMALIALLAATGMHTAAGRAVALGVGAAMLLFAARALRGGFVSVSRKGVTARTLLRSVTISPTVAKFEVVQRRGPGYTPYSALAIVGSGKPVLVREFSTSARNDREWLDALAQQLNAVIVRVRDAGASNTSR